MFTKHYCQTQSVLPQNRLLLNLKKSVFQYPKKEVIVQKQQASVQQQVYQQVKDDFPTVEEDGQQNDSKFKFDWEKQWYPVGFDSFFNKSRMHTLTILEKPVVIWWDTKYERWSAMLDICPHKLVPLSEGKITKDSKLQCGYHGWEFSSCGKCEKITFGDEGVKVGRRQSGTAYPLYVSKNIIWVKLQPFNPNQEPFSKEEYAQKVQEWENDNPQDLSKQIDDGYTAITEITRDLPYDYVTFSDNILDLSHVPFAHYKTQAQKILDNPYKCHLRPENSPQMLAAQMGVAGSPLKFDINFVYPTMLISTGSNFNKTFNIAIVGQATPSSPGKCRAVLSIHSKFVMNNQDVKSKLFGLIFKLKRKPKWLEHILVRNSVLDDDLYFLHKGERFLVQKGIESGKGLKNLAQLYSMPHQTDIPVTQFRKWLNEYAGEGPFGPMDENWLKKAGPIRSLDEVFERYNQHVKNCSVCEDALNNIKKIQKIFKSVMTFTVIASVVSLFFSIVQSTFLVKGLSEQVVQQGQGIFQKIGVNIINMCKNLVMGSTYYSSFAKHLGYTAFTLVLFLVYRRLQFYEKLFHRGFYPAPRNDPNNHIKFI